MGKVIHNEKGENEQMKRKLKSKQVERIERQKKKHIVEDGK